MKTNKILSGIDGTQVFESLSKDILLSYLGKSSKAIVFGTAGGNKFHEQLASLQHQLRDGSLHLNFLNSNRAKDDKLDIVAWIDFQDSLPSKLICFGQCKTGTSWQSHISALDPDDFLKKWFSIHPRLSPVRTFMITDVLHPDDFYSKAGNNLFFDRTRIMQMSIETARLDCIDDLVNWTQAAMKQFQLDYSASNLSN